MTRILSHTPSSSGISEDTIRTTFALIGQIDDQLVDLVLCTYVDTLW